MLARHVCLIMDWILFFYCMLVFFLVGRWYDFGIDMYLLLSYYSLVSQIIVELLIYLFSLLANSSVSFVGSKFFYIIITNICFIIYYCTFSYDYGIDN